MRCGRIRQHAHSPFLQLRTPDKELVYGSPGTGHNELTHMQNNPPLPQTPRWLSRARLTAGAAGLAAAALSLAACGPGKVNTSIKRERAEVRRETGELPPAGTAKRLEREQSVFLRRHAKDPVDWYPWGAEAFAKAQAEGRLVLVSIGYASCPWSQRMQDETFSDPVTARFMNRHFVNVLVDCGERTEVNNIYINFLFWKSRQSGWPLHLWLTPEGLPVFSGNYFPAKSSGNQAAWNPIIEHIQNSYADDPAHVQGKALEVVREYGREYRKLWKSTGAPPASAAQAACFDRLRSMFDPVHGGFTQAPKFALPYALEFLLNYTARLGEDRVGRKKEAENMLSVSLSNLARGGIHDQLGGGFHRYSMDIYWAVPQFEKMLYDQGALAGVLAEAAVTLNRPEYLETVR
ncbi:MAG: thioredoxin domain-containing protein, partial [Verrucomicrobiaceae bacterium]